LVSTPTWNSAVASRRGRLLAGARNELGNHHPALEHDVHRVAGALPLVDEGGFAEQIARLERGERILAIGRLTLNRHVPGVDDVGVGGRIAFFDHRHALGIARERGAAGELSQLLGAEMGKRGEALQAIDRIHVHAS
jgi:hypothetical protein